MKPTILAGLTILLPLALRAADITPMDVKPGLWQTTTKTEMGGMPAMPAMPQIPEETLSKMPPEQRARIEAMMKGRGAASNGGTVTKSCLTREMISDGPNFGEMQKNCTRKIVSSSSGKMQIHVECAMNDAKSEGDITVERLDSEHAKGNMVMKVTQAGHPMDMKMSFDTKWLGSDCGDVKPPTAK